MSVTIHTDLGDFEVELFVKEAPKSCENFLAHCGQGTYDDTKILKVIPGFIVQFGDPTNKGRGGESIWGGYFEDEFVEILKHRRGTLSMANAGSPNTNGSQFFIALDTLPALDGKYTIFGRVVNSEETLKRMEGVEVKKSKRPVEDYFIRDTTIHFNPLA